MATRKQEMSADSRRRLLEAAAALFAEKGYRETSLQDIGERADISRGSIAWHFGSKAGLLAAVIDHGMAGWLAALDDPKTGAGITLDDWIAAYRAGIQSRGGALLPMLLLEALGPRSEIRREYGALYRAVRASLATRIAAAQADGRLPAGVDADALAVALWGALIGLHLQWRLDPDHVDLDAAFAAVAALTGRP